ncbi:deoxyribodipyrimidine photo-lyase/cryptochrome family protein [Amphibiibacter pelophylacis]|uniref:FAD-binding domain-containing protein n=1 Tax=Amphibiibacter pelophylacis TaxID=1799477 RepID=A0ACC6NYH7_9BURK
MSYTVVWFKRDLRVQDHAPLHHAAGRGPVLALYVLEPSLWAQPDAALQHLNFLRETLRDLALQLRPLGATLQLAVGEVPEVLARLHASQPFARLMSHEETGNGHTFERDKAVARWCAQAGVQWQEWPQHGVVRRLPSRKVWTARWKALMHAAPWPTPQPGEIQGLTLPWGGERWPDAQPLGLSGPGLETPEPAQRQKGGRTLALQVLHDFLEQRSRSYRGGISSPLSAPTACSRLSPHLALGSLGMRELVQATTAHLQRLREQADPDSAWQRKGLSAFLSRLHWHCHFIQKLEDEPALEFFNVHRGYDGLREDSFNPAHFDALTAGRTGWPMVDACVAQLRATGWINFRMRAMLVSVAAYALWLHWRPVGLWLARQFLDYEPGIHWSQMQMQSGTTGINTTRVYNPVKQAQDHDPDGHFVRRWLPALRRVPDAWLNQPWLMPPDVRARCGVAVRPDGDWVDSIPQPQVDLASATREAKARLYERRGQPEVREAKAAIVEKHGSRLIRPRAKRSAASSRAAAKSSPPTQQQLDLGI